MDILTRSFGGFVCSSQRFFHGSSHHARWFVTSYKNRDTGVILATAVRALGLGEGTYSSLLCSIFSSPATLVVALPPTVRPMDALLAAVWTPELRTTGYPAPLQT